MGNQKPKVLAQDRVYEVELWRREVHRVSAKDFKEAAIRAKDGMSLSKKVVYDDIDGVVVSEGGQRVWGTNVSQDMVTLLRETIQSLPEGDNARAVLQRIYDELKAKVDQTKPWEYKEEK